MYDKFKRELPYRLLDTSKYPPEVAGRFNSFITTQFDDSLSVEMQMRSIIKWATDNFKLMDNEYNEFTDYIITKNINPFIEFLNDLIEYMNEFVDTFDTKFQEEILKNLQNWYDDGTLETLINESLDTKYHEMNNRLTTQLAQKVGGGKRASANDLEEDLLNFIHDGTGGPISVYQEPDNYSIGKEKLKLEAVDKENTTFYKRGKNLFNPEKATLGYSVNQTNGELFEGELFVSSDFIPIFGEKTYSFKRPSRIAYYDAQKKYISGRIAGEVETFSETAPPEARYVRYSVAKNNLHQTQIEQGSESTVFEPFKHQIPESDVNSSPLDSKRVKPFALTPENMQFFERGKNLVDSEKVTEGYTVSRVTGDFHPEQNVVVSDFIPVDETAFYTTNEVGARVGFYDENKKFIGFYQNVNDPNSFETPERTAFLRATTALVNKNVFQVERGNQKTNFEPYRIKVKSEYLSEASSHQPQPLYPSAAGIQMESRREGFRLLWHDTKNKIAYATDSAQKDLYRTVNNGFTWEKIWHFAEDRINFLYRTKTGAFLVWGRLTGRLFRLSSDLSTITRLNHAYVWRPLNPHISVDEKDGVIMFAEYSLSDEVRIWKSTDDGRSWEISRGGEDVLHYHTLQVDPYTGHWWATSGDAPQHCKILKSEDDGETWVTVDEGHTAIRACGLIFRSEDVMWAMDTGEPTNKVYKSDKENWDLIEVGEIEMTAIGVTKTIDNKMLISARYEGYSQSKDDIHLYLTDGEKIEKIMSLAISPDVDKAEFEIGRVDDENRFWTHVFGTSALRGTNSYILPIGPLR